jgi:type I restriction enzyme R subunit
LAQIATPGSTQIEAAAQTLARAAVTPLLNPALRRRILEMQRQNEQTIDRHTLDDVLYAGFDAQAVAKAQAKVADFRAWIAAHRDELTALQLLYADTRPLPLSLKDLRQLRDAIAQPPLAATPVQLWRAFQAVEGAQAVKASGGEVLTDLVHLVRHALLPSFTLVPYRDELRQRYRQWLAAREAGGTVFSAEQREWLDRMAEHIATSLVIARDDFDTGWFGQHGSLGRAHELFGAQLLLLMEELNERLAA